MNRTTLRVTCIVIAAGLVGYCVGRWKGSPAGTPSSDAGAELMTLRANNAALRAQLARRFTGVTERASTVVDRAPADTPATTSGSAQQVIERLNGLVDAKKRHLAAVAVPVLDMRSERLNPRFIGLFGLSDAEARAMQSAFDTTQQQMNQLTVANMKVHQAGNALVASVQPFDGSGVYDAMMDQASRILGPQRYAAFVALCDDELSRQFAQYGAEVRTVTVTQERTSVPGSTPMLRVREEYRRGHAAGSGSYFATMDTLPASAAWLAPYAATIAQLPVHQIPPFPGKH